MHASFREIVPMRDVWYKPDQQQFFFGYHSIPLIDATVFSLRPAEIFWSLCWRNSFRRHSFYPQGIEKGFNRVAQLDILLQEDLVLQLCRPTAPGNEIRIKSHSIYWRTKSSYSRNLIALIPELGKTEAIRGCFSVGESLLLKRCPAFNATKTCLFSVWGNCLKYICT